MFSVADLLSRAKANANIESDYRLAKVLRINQSALSNYKAGRSFPEPVILEALCALSGDDVAAVFVAVQAAKAHDETTRTIWEKVAKRMANTAILSVLFAIALIAAPAQSARAGVAFHLENVKVKLLYIVSITFLSVGHAWHRRLPSLFRLCCLSAC